MKPTVVVHTYNEKQNIEALIARILALRGGYSVLIVDDASPDGTGELAAKLSRANPDRVSVLNRSRKEGLGKAYAAGFVAALDGGADPVFQMDADFSHDPEALPLLHRPLLDNVADLVLGSRYVPGGGNPGWSLLRRAISRWGSFYARNILRLPQRDLTGGFKGWRSELLRLVDPATAAAKGYSFQIELTLRAIRAGARVVEVPILFHERRAGRSKMSVGIAMEAAWFVPSLALRPPAVDSFRWHPREAAGEESDP